VTNEPHGCTSTSLAWHALRDELLPGGLDVGHHALHTLLRARRHLRDAGAQHDGAGRPGRGELDEPQRVADLVIMIGVKADLIHVERLGPVDIGHRYRNQLDLPVHIRHRIPRPDDDPPARPAPGLALCTSFWKEPFSDTRYVKSDEPVAAPGEQAAPMHGNTLGPDR
jgi:hypothetical protein